MGALTALCLTLPPSLAAIWTAGMWLMRERDRKLHMQEVATIYSTKGKVDGVAEELSTLRTRLAEAETHIGQLTDRSLR